MQHNLQEKEFLSFVYTGQDKKLIDLSLELDEKGCLNNKPLGSWLIATQTPPFSFFLLFELNKITNRNISQPFENLAKEEIFFTIKCGQKKIMKLR